MLHDQEAVVILFQDGHELEGRKGPSDLQIGEVAIQTAEDARVVATDVEDLVTLQFQVAVKSVDQHLRRGDQDIESLGNQGDCWVEFYFHSKELRAEEIKGRAVHGANV